VTVQFAIVSRLLAESASAVPREEEEEDEEEEEERGRATVEKPHER